MLACLTGRSRKTCSAHSCGPRVATAVESKPILTVESGRQRMTPIVGHGRRWVITLAALLVALVATSDRGAASIVYADGETGVWIMEDDGSKQRLLVPRSAYAAPAISGVIAHPTRRALVLGGQVSVPANFAAAGCNLNCFAVYLWSAKKTITYTGPPISSDTRGFSVELPGGIASTGSIISDTWGVVNPSFGSVASTHLMTAFSVPGSSASLNMPCNNNFLDDLQPTPHPVDDRIAWVGKCASGEKPAVYVARPGGVELQKLLEDDGFADDLAWSPDGKTLAVAAVGDNPGIWRIDTTMTPPAATQLMNDEEGKISSLTVTGDGRIVFERDKAIWSIPPTCTGCTFPASATRLTTAATGQRSPSWTGVNLEDWVAPNPTRIGTTVRGSRLFVAFRSTEAATATITVERRMGRRYSPIRTISKTIRAGSRQLNSGALARGTFRVTLTLTDTAGNASPKRVLVTRR
jgi:hypothetical protein